MFKGKNNNRRINSANISLELFSSLSSLLDKYFLAIAHNRVMKEYDKIVVKHKISSLNVSGELIFSPLLRSIT